MADKWKGEPFLFFYQQKKLFLIKKNHKYIKEL